MIRIWLLIHLKLEIAAIKLSFSSTSDNIVLNYSLK